MQLWIDTTGLDSVDRCLKKNARSEDDIKGLMQLAILLVLGENIAVNGFEIAGVSEVTDSAMSQLQELGLDPKAVNAVQFTATEYTEMCHRAAEECADDLSWTYPISQLEISSLGDSHLDVRSRELAALQARERVYHLVFGTAPDYALNDTKNHALNLKGTGAIEYMVADSVRLRKALRAALAPDGISPTDFRRLNALMRFYLNRSLAGTARSYVPAVGRARIVRQDSRFLINQVLAGASNALQGQTQPLREESLLTTSSLAQRLLLESKGTPQGMLEAAIALRDRTGELRQWLSKLASAVNLDDPKGREKAAQKITQLASGLGKGGISILDALRLSVSVSWSEKGPSVSIGLSVTPGDVVKWIKSSLPNRKAVLLTEVSNPVLFPTVDPQDFLTTLRKNCGLNG